ncbi:hypothetical protein [Vibrio rumoiensis]|uniref:Uncharacterized protein n=1 Tax=Vibrio rumoiensis TaxID=76258 RepID=A0ABW7J0D2_9VIBR
MAMNKLIQQLEALETRPEKQDISEIIATSPDGKVTATVWKRIIDLPTPTYPKDEYTGTAEEAANIYREFMQ